MDQEEQLAIELSELLVAGGKDAWQALPFVNDSCRKCEPLEVEIDQMLRRASSPWAASYLSRFCEPRRQRSGDTIESDASIMPLRISLRNTCVIIVRPFCGEKDWDDGVWLWTCDTTR